MLTIVLLYVCTAALNKYSDYAGVFECEPCTSVCVITMSIAMVTVWHYTYPCTIGSGRIKGQFLPHICSERCTTISPSPSGNYGHPRNSGPPRCRLPPPERKEMHGEGCTQRLLSKSAAHSTSGTRWIIAVEWECLLYPDANIFQHNQKCDNKIHSHRHNTITLPNGINRHVLLCIEKETKAIF